MLLGMQIIMRQLEGTTASFDRSFIISYHILHQNQTTNSMAYLFECRFFSKCQCFLPTANIFNYFCRVLQLKVRLLQLPSLWIIRVFRCYVNRYSRAKKSKRPISENPWYWEINNGCKVVVEIIWINNRNEFAFVLLFDLRPVSCFYSFVYIVSLAFYWVEKNDSLILALYFTPFKMLIFPWIRGLCAR